VLTDKPEYKRGQSVQLLVQNPYWGPASALVVWGNKLQRKQRSFAQVRAGGRGWWLVAAVQLAPSSSVIGFVALRRILQNHPPTPPPSNPPPHKHAHPQVPRGSSNLTIGPIATECQGGCRAVVTLAITRPAANRAAGAAPAVPVSKLFDPLMPHTPQTTVAIAVPQVMGCVGRLGGCLAGLGWWPVRVGGWFGLVQLQQCARVRCRVWRSSLTTRTASNANPNQHADIALIRPHIDAIITQPTSRPPLSAPT